MQGFELPRLKKNEHTIRVAIIQQMRFLYCVGWSICIKYVCRLGPLNVLSMI